MALGRSLPARGWRVAAGVAALALAAAAPVGAATPLRALLFATDTTVALDGALLSPDGVAEEADGGLTVRAIAGIPRGSALLAYHRAADGSELFALDTPAALPGGLTVRPGDVVRLQGGTFQLAFDATARGLPRGVATDGIALSGGDLVLSFDTAVRLDGTTYEDEDAVVFDGASFHSFFDGSAAGIAPALDLDAIDVLANGHLLLSFDGSGSVASVSFDDEDVLEYAPEAATWEMVYDGSARHAGLARADLVAVSAEVVPPTSTPSETSTATATATPSLPPTSTFVPTHTGTATPAATSPPEPSPTRTSEPSHTPGSSTATATVDGGATATETPASTRTAMATATSSASPSASATATQSIPPTASATSASTPSASALASVTTSPTASVTPTATPTATGEATTPPSAMPTASQTASPTPTPVASGSPTSPASPAASATVTGSPTATASPGETPLAGCAGDCNENGVVTVDELVRGVNIALGSLDIAACPPFDDNGNGVVTVDELVRGVNNALTGCPAS
ncbi:hypothetical protein KF840_22855 [bacterium]|nr:hypothetical protein [bacterium]